MEIECNGVALPRVSLTGKQLDGANNSEPVSMLVACFAALDRALKALCSTGSAQLHTSLGADATATSYTTSVADVTASMPAMERFQFSLKQVRVSSKDPRVPVLERASAPVCFTPARI